jgi:hypothetical protein
MNNADILKITADSARIKTNSAEFLILHGVAPRKLPDAVSTTPAQMPLHRPGRPQALCPEIKRIIEALAKSMVEREDCETAAAAGQRVTDERTAA